MVHIRLTNVIIERDSNATITTYKYYYPRLCNHSDFKTEFASKWFDKLEQGEGNSLLYCIKSEDIYIQGTR